MPLTDDGRKLISTTEAQQLAQLTRDHIGLLIRQGKLEAMKVGNNWLIYADSFERFLAQPRKRGPKSQRGQQ